MIFDCMHDLPHPEEAMKGLRGVLKENGVVTMLDIYSSSDMYKQVTNQFLFYIVLPKSSCANVWTYNRVI